jgi:hypothetical protein
MRLPEARTLGLVLGALYLILGTVELIGHRNESAELLLLVGGSLALGGALVVAGTLARESHRALGLALLTAGAALGLAPTIRTVAVPLFAVLVLVQFYRDEDAGLTVFVSPQAAEGPEGPAAV